MITQYSQCSKAIQTDQGVDNNGSFSPLLKREQCFILQNIYDRMAAAVEEMAFYVTNMMKHAEFPGKSIHDCKVLSCHLLPGTT